jgi:hypothetical protein
MKFFKIKNKIFKVKKQFFLNRKKRILLKNIKHRDRALSIDYKFSSKRIFHWKIFYGKNNFLKNNSFVFHNVSVKEW